MNNEIMRFIKIITENHNNITGTLTYLNLLFNTHIDFCKLDKNKIPYTIDYQNLLSKFKHEINSLYCKTMEELIKEAQEDTE